MSVIEKEVLKTETCTRCHAVVNLIPFLRRVHYSGAIYHVFLDLKLFMRNEEDIIYFAIYYMASVSVDG